jgi:hypothetical protein
MRNGWVDRTGKIVIPVIWETARGFDAGGMAAVRRDGRWGWIDRTGSATIAPRWDLTDDFDADGKALAMADESAFVVDRRGEARRFDSAKCEPALAKRWESMRRRRPHGVGELGPGDVVNSTEVSFAWPDGFRSRWILQHPLVARIRGLAPWAAHRVSQWTPFRTLCLLESPDGAWIWRSDYHYFSFLQLPSAAAFLFLGAFCFWRARRDSTLDVRKDADRKLEA